MIFPALNQQFASGMSIPMFDAAPEDISLPPISIPSCLHCNYGSSTAEAGDFSISHEDICFPAIYKHSLSVGIFPRKRRHHKPPIKNYSSHHSNRITPPFGFGICCWIFQLRLSRIFDGERRPGLHQHIWRRCSLDLLPWDHAAGSAVFFLAAEDGWMELSEVKTCSWRYIIYCGYI